MVHGAISSVAKGPFAIFKSNQKITAAVYRHRVLPRIHQYITTIERQNLDHKRGILMKNNALVYIAKFTQSWHTYFGFNKMEWPANSSDLNPIENVWRVLKYCIKKRFPKTLNELRRYLIEEWDKLELKDFIHLHQGGTRALPGCY
jgi:transposase